MAKAVGKKAVKKASPRHESPTARDHLPDWSIPSSTPEKDLWRDLTILSAPMTAEQFSSAAEIFRARSAGYDFVGHVGERVRVAMLFTSYEAALRVPGGLEAVIGSDERLWDRRDTVNKEVSAFVRWMFGDTSGARGRRSELVSRVAALRTVIQDHHGTRTWGLADAELAYEFIADHTFDGLKRTAKGLIAEKQPKANEGERTTVRDRGRGRAVQAENSTKSHDGSGEPGGAVSPASAVHPHADVTGVPTHDLEGVEQGSGHVAAAANSGAPAREKAVVQRVGTSIIHESEPMVTLTIRMTEALRNAMMPCEGRTFAIVDESGLAVLVASNNKGDMHLVAANRRGHAGESFFLRLLYELGLSNEPHNR